MERDVLKDAGRRRLLAAGAMGLAAAAAPGAAQSTRSGRFAGRVVLITGGTSGIGEETARAFAREGARVVFNGRRAELGRRVQDSINADAATRAAAGEALYARSDVRDEAQVRDLVRTAGDRFDGVHIACNNAGVVVRTRVADRQRTACRDRRRGFRRRLGDQHARRSCR